MNGDPINIAARARVIRERDERRAAELRANLKRRKAKGRAGPDDGPSADTQVPPERPEK